MMLLPDVFYSDDDYKVRQGESCVVTFREAGIDELDVCVTTFLIRGEGAFFHIEDRVLSDNPEDLLCVYLSTHETSGFIPDIYTEVTPL